MIPISCEIDWMLKWANSPKIKITVDKLPEISDLRYQYKEPGMWFSEKDGYISFYYWLPPKQDNGFGGMQIPITMTSGEKVTLLGPWSSRAGVMNKHFLPQCVDVSIKTMTVPNSNLWTAGHVTLEFCLEAVKLCKEDVDIIVEQTTNEYCYIAKPRGILKPSS